MSSVDLEDSHASSQRGTDLLASLSPSTPPNLSGSFSRASSQSHGELLDSALPLQPNITSAASMPSIAWVRVNDFSRCSIKERTSWHLRHLQEPIAVNEAGISLLHYASTEHIAPAGKPTGSSRSARAKQKSSTRGRGQRHGAAANAATSPPGSDSTTMDANGVTLTPSTQVYFLHKCYRIVICLSISRSLFGLYGDVIVIELMEACLTNSLKALVKQVTNKAFNFALRVTIIACVSEFDEIETLVQGYALSEATLNHLLSLMPAFFTCVENKLANRVRGSHSHTRTGPRQDDQDAQHDSHHRDSSHSFHRLIEASLFSLQFLSPEAVPCILLIADGIFRVHACTHGPDSAYLPEFEDLTMRLTRDDVSVSLLSLRSPNDPQAALGYIADPQAIEVIIENTGGSTLRGNEVDIGLLQARRQGPATTLQQRYHHAQVSVGMNTAVQVALLLRPSRLNLPLPTSAQAASTSTSLLASSISAGPQRETKLKMYTLPLIRLHMLVGLRTSEGFQARSLHISPPGTSHGLHKAEASNLANENVTADSLGSGGRRSKGRSLSASRSRISQKLASMRVCIRMTRALHPQLALDYEIDYTPLGGSQAWEGVGAVSVVLYARGDTGWIERIIEKSNEDSQVFRQFLKAVQVLDISLFRMISLVKPPTSIPAVEAKPRRRSKGRDSELERLLALKEEEIKLADVLWIGKMPLSEWKRWLKVEYFELVSLEEGEGKDIAWSSSDSEDTESVEGSESEEETECGKRRQLSRRSLADNWTKRRTPLEEGVHVREDLIVMLLTRWCTQQAGRDLFWRVFCSIGEARAKGQEEVLGRNDQTASINSLDRVDSAKRWPGSDQGEDKGSFSFCVVKLVWDSAYVAGIWLGFFGLDTVAIRQQLYQLQSILMSSNGSLLLPEHPLAYQLVLPRRPLPDLKPGPFAVEDTSSVRSLYNLTRYGSLVRSYLLHRRFEWALGDYLHLPKVARLLTQSQLAAGFTMVHQGSLQTVLVQHAHLSVLPAQPQDISQRVRTDNKALHHAALVQYRICIEHPHGLVTEIWMEPQYGFDLSNCQPHTQVFDQLAEACHARDGRLLSALDTFHYIKRLCVGSEKADAEGKLQGRINLGELLAGADVMQVSLRLFARVSEPHAQQYQASLETERNVGNLQPDNANHAYISQQSRQAESTSKPTEFCIPADSKQWPEDVHNRNLWGRIVETLRALLDAEIPGAGPQHKQTTIAQTGLYFAHRADDNAMCIWYLPNLQASVENMRLSQEAPCLTICIYTLTLPSLLRRLVYPSSACPYRHVSTYTGDNSAPATSHAPLIATICYMHRRYFTQVAYNAQRSQPLIAIHPEDLHTALGYCSEVSIDIDLSQLRRVARLVSKESANHGGNDDGYFEDPIFSDLHLGSAIDRGSHVHQQDEPPEPSEEGRRIDLEFQQIMSTYLAPVPGTDYWHYTGSQEMLEDAGAESGMSVAAESSDTSDDQHGMTPIVGSIVGEIELASSEEFATESMPTLPVVVRRASDSLFGTIKDPIYSPRARQQSPKSPRGTQQGTYGFRLPKHVSSLGHAAHEDASATPCFLRLEVIRSPSHASEAESISVHTHQSPWSALTKPRDSSSILEDSQPRMDHLPQISIRIICATHTCLALDTPPVQASRRPMENSVAPHDKSNVESIDRTIKETKLPMQTFQFLQLMRSVLRAWAAGQILGQLLTLSPIPASILPVVKESLSNLRAESVTHLSVPLVFVAEPEGGLGERSPGVGNRDDEEELGQLSPRRQTHHEAALALFHQQVLSGTFVNARWIGDLFLVVDAGFENTQLETPQVDDGSMWSPNAERLGSSRPTSPTRDAHTRSSSFRLDSRTVCSPCRHDSDDWRLPYWAVLQIVPSQSSQDISLMSGNLVSDESRLQAAGLRQSHCMTLTLHHPTTASWYASRLEVVEKIRTGILAAVHSVNQTLLLKHLLISRYASPLLIAPTDDDIRLRDGEGDTDKSFRASGDVAGLMDSSLTRFEFEAFSCPLQLSLRFPIYHRLNPAAALRELESSVLSPLTVHNRVHTFVHKDRAGVISYLRFETTTSGKSSEISPAPDSTSVRDAEMSGPPLRSEERKSSIPTGRRASNPSLDHRHTPRGLQDHVKRSRERQISLKSQATTPLSTSWAVHPSTTTYSYITLHIKSNQVPSSELTLQLRRLLETRLSELAISYLSDLLSRNPRLQLTCQDLNLVRAGSSRGLASRIENGGTMDTAAPATSGEEVGKQEGGKSTRAVLNLPAHLLEKGDPYLFLLYLRQNTHRAQYINNLIAQLHAQSHWLSRPLWSAALPDHSHTSKIYAATPPATTRNFPAHFTFDEPSPKFQHNSQALHPALSHYSGLIPVSSRSSESTHPALWNVPAGVPVGIDDCLLHLYYNHNRPEIYEARKDVPSTLSNRGARLAKEVGKGLALINMRPVDRLGKRVRSLRSGIGVRTEEVEVILKAAKGDDRKVPHVPERPIDSPAAAPPFPGLPSASKPTLHWVSSELLSACALDLHGPGGKDDIQADNRDAQANEYLAETDPQELCALSIEIVGSVNSAPLLEWLKLCVDQVLHDYVIERLLGYLKGRQDPPQPRHGLSGLFKQHRRGQHKSPQLEKLAKAFTDRGSKVLGPLTKLLRSAMQLDSPSVRRSAFTEPFSEKALPDLTAMLCHGIIELDPYLAPTLSLYRSFSRAQDGNKPNLALMDSIELNRDLESQTTPVDKWILLCGLCNGEDTGAFSFRQLSPATSLSPAAIIGLNSRYSLDDSLTTHDTHSLQSRSSNSLPQSELLYGTLSSAEGATAGMTILGATDREMFCVVSLSTDEQEILMYNTHPDSGRRRIAAFKEYIDLAIWTRWLQEGQALCRLGLLHRGSEWWSGLIAWPGADTEAADVHVNIGVEEKAQLGHAERQGQFTARNTTSQPFPALVAPSPQAASAQVPDPIMTRVMEASPSSKRPLLSRSSRASTPAGTGNANPALTPSMLARMRASANRVPPGAQLLNRQPSQGQHDQQHRPEIRSPSNTIQKNEAGRDRQGFAEPRLQSSNHVSNTANSQASRTGNLVQRTAQADELARAPLYLAKIWKSLDSCTLASYQRLSRLLRPLLPYVEASVASGPDLTADNVHARQSSTATTSLNRANVKVLWTSLMRTITCFNELRKLQKYASVWTWYAHLLRLQYEKGNVTNVEGQTKSAGAASLEIEDSSKTGLQGRKVKEAAEEGMQPNDVHLLLKHARYHCTQSSILLQRAAPPPAIEAPIPTRSSTAGPRYTTSSNSPPMQSSFTQKVSSALNQLSLGHSFSDLPRAPDGSLYNEDPPPPMTRLSSSDRISAGELIAAAAGVSPPQPSPSPRPPPSTIPNIKPALTQSDSRQYSRHQSHARPPTSSRAFWRDMVSPPSLGGPRQAPSVTPYHSRPASHDHSVLPQHPSAHVGQGRAASRNAQDLAEYGQQFLPRMGSQDDSFEREEIRPQSRVPPSRMAWSMQVQVAEEHVDMPIALEGRDREQMERRKKGIEDFSSARQFLEAYLRYLRMNISLELLKVMAEESVPGTVSTLPPAPTLSAKLSIPAGQVTQPGPDWKLLTRYLYRPICMSNSILLVHLAFHRREISKLGSPGPLGQCIESEIRIMASLYTLDVSAEVARPLYDSQRAGLTAQQRLQKGRKVRGQQSQPHTLSRQHSRRRSYRRNQANAPEGCPPGLGKDANYGHGAQADAVPLPTALHNMVASEDRNSTYSNIPTAHTFAWPMAADQSRSKTQVLSIPQALNMLSSQLQLDANVHDWHLQRLLGALLRQPALSLRNAEFDADGNAAQTIHCNRTVSGSSTSSAPVPQVSNLVRKMKDLMRRWLQPPKGALCALSVFKSAARSLSYEEQGQLLFEVPSDSLHDQFLEGGDAAVSPMLESSAAGGSGRYSTICARSTTGTGVNPADSVVNNSELLTWLQRQARNYGLRPIPDEASTDTGVGLDAQFHIGGVIARADAATGVLVLTLSRGGALLCHTLIDTSKDADHKLELWSAQMRKEAEALLRRALKDITQHRILERLRAAVRMKEKIDGQSTDLPTSKASWENSDCRPSFEPIELDTLLQICQRESLRSIDGCAAEVDNNQELNVDSAKADDERGIRALGNDMSESDLHAVLLQLERRFWHQSFMVKGNLFVTASDKGLTQIREVDRLLIWFSTTTESKAESERDRTPPLAPVVRTNDVRYHRSSSITSSPAPTVTSRSASAEPWPDSAYSGSRQRADNTALEGASQPSRAEETRVELLVCVSPFVKADRRGGLGIEVVRLEDEAPLMTPEARQFLSDIMKEVGENLRTCASGKPKGHGTISGTVGQACQGPLEH